MQGWHLHPHMQKFIESASVVEQCSSQLWTKHCIEIACRCDLESQFESYVVAQKGNVASLVQQRQRKTRLEHGEAPVNMRSIWMTAAVDWLRAPLATI